MATVLLGVALLSGCGPIDLGQPAGSASPASSAGSQASSPAASAAATGSASSRRPVAYVFPVRSKAASYGRAHHDYPATDIFAPCGTSVVAPIDGQVTDVSRKDTWSARKNDGATRGGLSVTIVGTDGVRYYGSHLRSIESSIVPGRQVRAGDLLGKVGHTGDARPVPCHLHFGISPPCGKADWWNRRGLVSPYRFLKSWQAGKNLSPVRTVAAWRDRHGCPKAATIDR